MADSVEFGDFEIDKLEIVKLDDSKRLSIKSYVQTLDIYEDLMHATIYADITILDGVELKTSFPIIGEEYFDIEFTSKKLEEPFKMKLYVASIGDDNTVNDRGKVYRLGLCSEEYLINQEGVFSRKYKDMNENIVKNILTDKLRPK